MLGVPGMVAALQKLPKDPTSVQGYSIVPVHAWSHSYADIVAVAQVSSFFCLALPLLTAVVCMSHLVSHPS